MTKSLTDLRQLQRNQLARMNKEELIDAILAPVPPDDRNLLAVTAQLALLVREFADLKKSLTSQNSEVNKKLMDLQSQVNSQAVIMRGQQQFLEALDRKERECNVVVLGIPEGQESLDGATTDDAEVNKVWEVLGVPRNETSLRRLGRENAIQQTRKRPILMTLPSKLCRDTVLEKCKKVKVEW